MTSFEILSVTSFADGAGPTGFTELYADTPVDRSTTNLRFSATRLAVGMALVRQQAGKKA